MRRFILLLSEETDDQVNAFCSRLRGVAPGTGWWHWVPRSWLMSTDGDKLNVEKIRDLASEVFGEQVMLAMEIPPGPCAWAGWGYEKSKKKPGTFDWIEDGN